MTSDHLNGNYGQNNILETVYAKQSVGKSHRFYFTAGERQECNDIFISFSNHKSNSIYICSNLKFRIEYVQTIELNTF